MAGPETPIRLHGYSHPAALAVRRLVKWELSARAGVSCLFWRVGTFNQARFISRRSSLFQNLNHGDLKTRRFSKLRVFRSPWLGV
jgi:hypothetical protein